MNIVGPTSPLVQKKLLTSGGAGSTGGTVPGGADPFAQTNNAQIAALVNKYVSGLPQAQTPAQITAGARSQIQPQLSALAAAISGQQKTADNAITGASNGLASYLGGIDYSAPTAGASDRQAAIDNALRSSLSGDSGAAAAQLAQNWQSIGEPAATDPAVAALNTQGTGLANAALATGSASLSNLNAEQANNEAYGLKQPGIAKTAGIQQLGQAAATAQGNLATGTTQIESELPTILSGLQSASSTAATNRSNLAEQIWEAASGQNLTKATAEAGLLGDGAKAAAPQHFSAGGGEYSFDPSSGTVTTLVAPPVKTKTTKTVSVAPGSTVIDPATGQVIYKAPPKKGTTPTPVTLSPSQSKGLATQIKQWHTGQTGTSKGLPIDDPSSKYTYTEALTHATAQAPNTPGGKAKAAQLVNAEYGTPKQIAVKAVSAAKKAGSGLTQAVTQLLSAQADGSADLPIASYVSALSKVYGQRPEDVHTIISQVGQLMQSGQIGG